MSEDGEFQKNLISYLEGCQKGEFLTGTLEEVCLKIPEETINNSIGIHKIIENKSTLSSEYAYQDPTQIMPEKPPNSCDLTEHKNCSNCEPLKTWWVKFQQTVGDILLRSNIHRCSLADIGKSKNKAKGCLNNDGVCKAHFPHPIVTETTVNTTDGYINIKKHEPMLKTIYYITIDVTQTLLVCSQELQLKQLYHMLLITLVNLSWKHIKFLQLLIMFLTKIQN